MAENTISELLEFYSNLKVEREIINKVADTKDVEDSFDSIEEIGRNIFDSKEIEKRRCVNIGSIFRTAEAMGAEKVYISPFCTDPEQPRAIRSGMGCIETLGWERCALDELPQDIPVFALETGGTDINEFVFPKEGICIIGSEELGCSPEALKRATYGRVSIPMKGLKASLNVGVAFGILMQKWIERKLLI